MSSLQKLKNQAHEVCFFLPTSFSSRGLFLIPEQRRFSEVVSTLPGSLEETESKVPEGRRGRGEEEQEEGAGGGRSIGRESKREKEINSRWVGT
mmetsp:Transcript_3161/g.7615  ORF Transcript_3161/g.7615 Transcript_3161/m.7615 type:complete len:94 (-) Transcript_3161:683-964(-)